MNNIINLVFLIFLCIFSHSFYYKLFEYVPFLNRPLNLFLTKWKKKKTTKYNKKMKEKEKYLFIFNYELFIQYYNLSYYDVNFWVKIKESFLFIFPLAGLIIYCFKYQYIFL